MGNLFNSVFFFVLTVWRRTQTESDESTISPVPRLDAMDQGEYSLDITNTVCEETTGPTNKDEKFSRRRAAVVRNKGT